MKLKCTVFICLCFLLSGCLYPEDEQARQAVHKSQIQSVQTAVDQYQKEKIGLPILNRDQDTPIYRKYPIDFRELTPLYLPQPPSNAYVEGGIYKYALVGVEKTPTVKLIDLTIVDKIQTLQRRVTLYHQQHGSFPTKLEITKHLYTLDYEKLGYDTPPYVVSPYSRKNLRFIMDDEGHVYVDYNKDLYEMLQKSEQSYKKGQDIRDILVENSFFVPVYSVPYTAENGEPLYLMK